MKAWLCCALALGGCGSSFEAAPVVLDASSTGDASSTSEGSTLDSGASLDASTGDRSLGSADSQPSPSVDAGDSANDPPGDDAAAVDELQVDAGDDAAPLCCWIAWTSNGGCCPAPDDPQCAYACDKAPVACVAGDTTCTSGGCFGTVRACP